MCRGCGGNEVTTVVNSEVSRLTEHHGASCEYGGALNDV